MNLNKFEYWAKRQGMSCVKSKDKDTVYTNEQTEIVYKYWLAAHSTVIQDLYDDQVQSEIIYKSLVINNKYFINACEQMLENLYTEPGELDWLFKFSKGTALDNSFVEHKLAAFKLSCLTNLRVLSKHTNLVDFATWKTKEDYTRNKNVIYDSVFGVTSPGYSAYGLESALKSKIGPVIMHSRTTLAGYEYKFADSLVELAIELSEKDNNG